MRLFLETLLCGIWVYSSLLRSHCLSQQLQCFLCAVLSLTKKKGVDVDKELLRNLKLHIEF